MAIGSRDCVAVKGEGGYMTMKTQIVATYFGRNSLNSAGTPVMVSYSTTSGGTGPAVVSIAAI